MQLSSQSFNDGDRMAGVYAFGVIDPQTHVALSANRNPHLAWTDVPAGTQSFALICHDPDVPSVGDDVNLEGRIVLNDLPRVDFFHWVLVDIAADTREIPAGAYSNGITAHGKSGPDAPNGTRQGINDYTGWFAQDPEMSGDYYGYDGPCPPWNDARMHHYVFTLYALNVPTLEVAGRFTGRDARQAIAGHILAHASITGTYTLNPALA